MSVRGGACRRFDTDIAGRAGAVVDDDLLAQQFRHCRLDDPRDWSDAPPGANGTIMRTDRVGIGVGGHAAPQTKDDRTAATAMRLMLDMRVSPNVFN